MCVCVQKEFTATVSYSQSLPDMSGYAPTVVAPMQHSLLWIQPPNTTVSVTTDISWFDQDLAGRSSLSEDDQEEEREEEEKEKEERLNTSERDFQKDAEVYESEDDVRMNRGLYVSNIVLSCV